jgi:hypothetical protein
MMISEAPSGAKGGRVVSTRVKALLILAGAVFFCCGAIPAAVAVRNAINTLNGTNEANQAAEKFWTAIADLQFTTAYEMLDPQTQKTIGQQDFTDAIFNAAAANRDLYLPDQAAVENAQKALGLEGRVMSVKGRIVDKDNKQVGTTTSWLRYDGTAWKILYFFLDQ